MERDIEFYCYCFKKLRRDRKKGGAPHKPILLISIIQAFQKRLIFNDEIYITPDLVGLFKSNWNNLVETEHHCLFSLPFYHMNSEPFWKLIPNVGCEKWVSSKGSMKSFSNLSIAIKCAKLDKELANLLSDYNNSEILLNFLLDTFFKNTRRNILISKNYLFDIENQIVKEDQKVYSAKILEIQKQLDVNSYQEEIFVRGGVFKRMIPKIYNHTCCISGLRIDSISNVSVIDACHIIPFSESYNDTISNGIALCPNLHRVFDRGLISIDENYRVIVSNSFIETEKSNYGVRQFEGSRILLPKDRNHYPSQESLSFHRNKFSF